MIDIWQVTVVSLVLVALWACILLLYKFLPALTVKFPSREPPQISSTVPYIGHLIGIFIHKNHYYTQLSKLFQFPILKLPILGGQLYIIKSPKLIAAIERKPNTISFWHVEASAIGRVAGLRPEATETVSKGVGDNPDSFWLKGLRAIHHAMAPGEGINGMVLEAARTSVETLRRFDTESRGQRINLWDWVSHEITLSHTNAVYGQRNPYKDRQVEAAFWDFSQGSYKLLLGTYSNLLAPAAHRGREKVVEAFKPYFLDFNRETTAPTTTTSPLMQARMSNMANTLEIEDMARMECVNGLAILANTVPSAFWTLVQVYGHRDLLERVREGAAAAAAVVVTDENLHDGRGMEAKKKTKKMIIDINILLKNSSIIQPIVQEVIRLRTTGIGPRFVREDILLQDRYLLKKGSMVVIPNRAVHFDPEVWGQGVDGFDERRFWAKGSFSGSSSPSSSSLMRGDKGKGGGAGSGERKVMPTTATAYRGFGGGATICPGKHFAVDGIAVFVALVVLRYDIFPVRLGWGDLKQEMKDMALQLGSPEGKFEVEFRLREGMEGVEWGVR
ncbi:MAG: hypothetical protein Q9216_002622 [Gyalolechia sp. 2 TL-2023]